MYNKNQKIINAIMKEIYKGKLTQLNLIQIPNDKAAVTMVAKDYATLLYREISEFENYGSVLIIDIVKDIPYSIYVEYKKLMKKKGIKTIDFGSKLIGENIIFYDANGNKGFDSPEAMALSEIIFNDNSSLNPGTLRYDLTEKFEKTGMNTHDFNNNKYYLGFKINNTNYIIPVEEKDLHDFNAWSTLLQYSTCLKVAKFDLGEYKINEIKKQETTYSDDIGNSITSGLKFYYGLRNEAEKHGMNVLKYLSLLEFIIESFEKHKPNIINVNLTDSEIKDLEKKINNKKSFMLTDNKKLEAYKAITHNFKEPKSNDDMHDMKF